MMLLQLHPEGFKFAESALQVISSQTTFPLLSAPLNGKAASQTPIDAIPYLVEHHGAN